MFAKSQLINKRPNVRQYTDRLRDVQDDEDDEDPGISSFAKSKVDDDDEKFKNRNQDPDDHFLDNLIKRKTKQDPKQDSNKSINSSIIPSTPPPPQSSTGKKTENEISKTDPKQTESKTNTNTEKKDTQKKEQNQKIDTPVKQPQTSKFETPKQPPKEPVQKQSTTPIQPNVQPKVEPPKTITKTPIKNDNSQQQNPAPIQPNQQKQPEQQQIEQPTKTTQSSAKSNQQQSKPNLQPQKSIESPSKPIESPLKPNQSPTKPPAQESTKQPLKPIPPPINQAEENDEEEQTSGAPQIANQRPNFVRRGQNQGKDIANTIKCIPEDRIQAIEPKNNIEVSRLLSLKFIPQKEYFDTTFPANESQVFQTMKNSKKVDYKRFTLDRDLETHSVVDPNDIVPGLYSSELMQALAAVAEQPQLISRILEDQVYNEYGFYYVRLCIGGVWKYILIDDFQAYIDGKSVTATTSVDSRSKSLQKSSPGYKSEMWPFLIEKAFAKEYGSYQDSQSNVKNFLEELTGAPVLESQLNHENLKLILSEDISVIKIQDQFFTFLQYDGKDITLRNPWGWVTNPLAQTTSDGQFKLSLKNIQNGQIFVAQHNPNYYYVSYNVKALNDAYSQFTVTINENTEATFSLHQRDKRYFRNNLTPKYEYSFARILIFNSNQQLIGNSYGTLKRLNVSLNLEPGIYTIINIIDFPTQLLDSTLSYYGSAQIKIIRNDYRQQPNYLAQLLCNEIVTKGQKKTQGQVDEYVLEFPFKLSGWAWKYNGQNSFNFQKDLNKISKKETMFPLTFINKEDTTKLKSLTTEQLRQLKLSSWQNSSSFTIEFNSKSAYAIIFK